MAARYQGPDGTVITTPAGGGHALIALGWEPLDPPEESDATEIPDGPPTTSWKIPQLKAYADEHEIDLGAAKKKDEILAVLVPVTTVPDTKPVVPVPAAAPVPPVTGTNAPAE